MDTIFARFPVLVGCGFSLGESLCSDFGAGVSFDLLKEKMEKSRQPDDRNLCDRSADARFCKGWNSLPFSMRLVMFDYDGAFVDGCNANICLHWTSEVILLQAPWCGIFMLMLELTKVYCFLYHIFVSLQA